jgi:DNA-binding IclR family transcriptional regulator
MQLRHVGIARALAIFAGTFGDGNRFDATRSRQYAMYQIEPEPGVFFLAVGMSDVFNGVECCVGVHGTTCQRSRQDGDCVQWAQCRGCEHTRVAQQCVRGVACKLLSVCVMYA